MAASTFEPATLLNFSFRGLKPECMIGDVALLGSNVGPGFGVNV